MNSISVSRFTRSELRLSAPAFAAGLVAAGTWLAFTSEFSPTGFQFSVTGLLTLALFPAAGLLPVLACALLGCARANCG